MNNAEILVIDDELQICKLLAITLESNDFNVTLAHTGKEGIITAANHPPDLIILDLGLPDMSGHDVLGKLREWYFKPILILSVQNDEVNVIKALDNGANDYLSKPFRTGELLARIRTALRSSTVNNDENVILTCGNLTIDFASRIIKKNGEIIKLTSTEYALLALMAKHEGRVLTHQFLLMQIWGPGYINQSQYLRVFIAQLRKKIEIDPNQPEFIVTASGVGYRFVCNS
jgi:two-component system, OmpR family, KDP operon response regulator KdpE